MSIEPGGEWVEGWEWSSCFQTSEDLIEEEELTYSLKPEGKTRAPTISEEFDFYSLEERCLMFVF